MARQGVFAYIKSHWVAYLIGAAAAIVLGFGLAYFLGMKWSTPDEVREERITAENEDTQALDALAGDADSGQTTD